MADLFGFTSQTIKTPFTADKATIQWGSVVTGATQVTVSYAQQVNRRRTIGNRDTVIFASQPNGNINIQRLVTNNSSQLFKSPGWSACTPGTITLTLGGCPNDGGTSTYTATGCVVSQFSITAEAESLSIMDNVVVEFLQLTAG